MHAMILRSLCAVGGETAMIFVLTKAMLSRGLLCPKTHKCYFAIFLRRHIRKILV